MKGWGKQLFFKTGGGRGHERERRWQFEERQHVLCAPRRLSDPRQPSSQRWPPGLATATPSARPRPVGEWGRRADATHRRDEDVNGHGGETMGPSENRVLQKWRRLRRGSNVVGVWSGVGSVLSDLGFQLLAGGATLDWSWCGRNSSQQVLLANQSPFQPTIAASRSFMVLHCFWIFQPR